MLVRITLIDLEKVITNNLFILPAVHAALPVQHKYSGNKLQCCGRDVRGTQKTSTRVGRLWMAYGD